MGIFSISGLILVTSLLHVESTWGFSLLLGMVLLTIIPVDENSALGRGIARWITKTVPKHFPLKVLSPFLNIFQSLIKFVLRYIVVAKLGHHRGC